MKKIKPLVTETPQGNYEFLHNMTGIKDKEVYLRDFNGEGDLNLVDYCKKECHEKCDITIDAGAEEFGEYMDCDCPIALLYHMAVGHAELRHRLSQYEETGLTPNEIQERTCDWEENDDGIWKCSKCSIAWSFIDQGPKENSVNYCPECGRKIIKFNPFEDEEERE